jgi:CHAT domain-containing protein
VAVRLAAARSVIIVPDSTLQRLPFAALMNPANGKYLVETHLVFSSPSAAVYRASSERLTSWSAGPLTAAVYANPSLRGSSFDGLPTLRASEAEGARVASIYPGSLFLKGEDVTTVRFEASAPAHDVVHFGGHAIIQRRQPWSSAMLLAASGDDGVFAVPRISRMTFRRTRLVVLAACSTTQGKGSDVEGASSLARAFLVAGVPSVIATLWDLEDGESGPLMQALHRHFVTGAPAAEALRSAQLEALRSRSAAMRHPGYWSVFALMGASA